MNKIITTECGDASEEERARMTESLIKAEKRAEERKKKKTKTNLLAVRDKEEIERLINDYQQDRLEESNQRGTIEKCVEIALEFCKREAENTREKHLTRVERRV